MTPQDFWKAVVDTGPRRDEAHRMRKSVGHLAFAFEGHTEFYEQDGQVYRARASDAFDTTGRRYARWECARSHFERNKRHMGVVLKSQ